MSRALNMIIGSLASFVGVGLSASAAFAVDALKTINQPGGGEITYGSLTGQKTLLLIEKMKHCDEFARHPRTTPPM